MGPHMILPAVLAGSHWQVPAAEIIRKNRGRDDLSGRSPWNIAFLFGLLHGFGFGFALREIGLLQRDVPLALFTFNLGVEAGQLAFVAFALSAIACLTLLLAIHSERPRLITAYFVGSLSTVWFIQRAAWRRHPQTEVLHASLSAACLGPHASPRSRNSTAVYHPQGRLAVLVDDGCPALTCRSFE
jgi:HupE / UreJ protein